MDNDIKIGKMTIGVCMTNTYFIYRESTKECVVVDPADKGGLIYDKLTEAGLKVMGIILTHGHFDHIWGIDELKEKTGVLVYSSEDEAEVLAEPSKNLSSAYGRNTSIKADVELKDEEEITLAGISFKMLKTPGHTPGGCCYYLPEANFLISGDTLFCESVGRTDFPGGSMSTLVRSIKEKLLLLPENAKVYPGHGGTTTIGYEKENNPFL